MRQEKSLSKNSRRSGTKTSGSAEITISFRKYYALCMVFLALPVVIFCIGYLKLLIGIPAAVLFAGITVYAVIDSDKDASRQRHELGKSSIRIKTSTLIVFAVTALLVSYVTGVGEFIYTLQDHMYRRAMLRDLINYKWPVIYDYATQTNPAVKKIYEGLSGQRGFSYYMIYWMPSAVIGKIAGMTAASVSLLIWNAFGIWLTLVGLSKVTGKATKIIPFVYVFFAGLDAIPDAVYLLTQYDSWFWIEGYVPYISYVANFTEYANVFNQAVPCFLITTLFLISHSQRNMGLLGSLMFIYSPWATIGLVPIVAVMVFGKEFKTGKIKDLVINLLSFVNILSVIAALLIFGSLYLSNPGAIEYRGFTWTFYDNPLGFIPAYLIFISVEILPFVIILYKREKKNPIFIVSVIVLLLIPLYRIDEMNDFSMRASMPALFILSVMFIRYLQDMFARDASKFTKKDWLKSCLVTLVMILMMFPACENLFVIVGSQMIGDAPNYEDIGSFGDIRNEKYAEVIQRQFFVEDYQDKFFYRYLAK